MLRLANEENLDGNNLLLLQKLKTTAQSKGLEPADYLFDIKIKTFPRYSLDNEDEDMFSIEEFLSKLKIFSAQANNVNLKQIIKNEIKDLCMLTRNEVDENYLKIKDAAEKVWKEANYYLLKNNDIFANIFKNNIQFNITEHAVSFTGRDEEIENLHKKLQDGGEFIMSHVTCLTGLGGIGKTELSRKYISQYKNCYDGNLIWIDSRNVPSLIECFRKLAQCKLDISVKDIDGNEKDIKFIVEEVYRFFSRRKCLFIFDDVESYKDIKKFLPQSVHFNDTKPQILITSRCRDWDTEEGIKVINLKALKSDEAVKFVTDILKNYNVSQEKDAEELANQFQCLPLALRHAVSYINQEDKNFKKRGNNSFKISDYLEIYQQQKSKFLQEVYYLDSSDDNQTVLTIWNTTLEKIAKERLHGRQAIDILNIMAYFNPNKIDIGVLFTMTETDERWKSLSLLDAYSMIDLRNGIADIHSLVQEVTRQKLERENKEEEVLKRALKGIDNSKISKEDHICNITSVWDHSSKYPNLIQKFGRFEYGDNKDTPIHFLTTSGNLKGICKILEILPEVKDTRNKYGETPLYAAIAYNYKEIVKCLIEVYKVNPLNAVSENGHKPITVAALHGNEDLVKYFVSKGADVNTQVFKNMTTLDFALLSCNKNLVKYLLDIGANINNCDQMNSVLQKALRGGYMHHKSEDDIYEIIKLCLEKNNDLLKKVDIVGRTVLHTAVELNQRNIVEKLIEYKDININAQTHSTIIKTDPVSCTATTLVAEKGYSVGYTALHIAVNENNKEIVEILLKQGAHYDIKNGKDMTPLDLAKPESDVKNLLNYINNLFTAVQNGEKDEVYCLLEENNYALLITVLNAQNINGHILAQLACIKEMRNIAELLVEKLKTAIEEVSLQDHGI